MLRLFRFIKNLFTTDYIYSYHLKVIVFVLVGGFHSIWMNIGVKGIVLGMLVHLWVWVIGLLSIIVRNEFQLWEFTLYIKSCWANSKPKEKQDENL